MDKRPICSVCQMKPTKIFLYGVDCCHSCAMVHRRHCNSRDPENDPKTNIGNPDCRFCCFKKNQLITKIHSRFDDLGAMFEDLSIRDKHREYVFYSFSAAAKMTVNDAVLCKKIEFDEKPLGKSSSFEEWSTMSQLSIIDFLKNLELVNKIGEVSNTPGYLTNDSKIFIRAARFRYGIFMSAFKSYQKKRAYLAITDDVDIFPDLTGKSFSPDLLNSIRCQLVHKLIELKITEHEYLVLSMILLCISENISEVSVAGRKIIENYRDKYTNALFQHCLIQNKFSGPSRFAELLSLIQSVESTHQKINNFVILFRMWTPVIPSKDLVTFE